MATFNFDMHRIGQTIARLRREHNMTQMALADAMGVSFQAVSNWERGQSMPDISKLPVLAELFGTTIDELLGRHSPLIEKAAENKLAELTELDVAELTEAAPLLPPRQMDDLAGRLLELPNLPDMGELLPFLPTNQVDALLMKQVEANQDPTCYVVFASTRAVDEAAHALIKQGKSIHSLAPFMSTATLDAIFREQRGEDTDLLPFISQKALQDVFIERLKAGLSVSEMLPFADNTLLNKLAQAASSKD